MSSVQKSYVDFRNLGDTGTDTTAAIQPIVDGEPASSLSFARPSENLRSRTEISRETLQDLLYYRDRTYRYLLELSGGGMLTWGVSGAGVANNTTTLTLRPFLTPRTNVKGTLLIGDGTNDVLYAVAATAYATDGVNAVTVEHRDVGGTVTPTASITAGPVYRLVIIFDSTNTAHDAPTVAGVASSAFAGVAALAGKFTVTGVGGAGIAVSPLAETSFDIRTHPTDSSGNATADVEAHQLSAGALATFTGLNPLADGDLVAIRYDYVVEDGSDGTDPKGGVPGGRAESNEARSNANVYGNLFIAQDHPEWLPGSIPLCKRVGSVLHWVDGTVLADETSGAPGTSLGSFIDGAVFSGVPTLIINGGIDTGVADLQAALVSVDQRLGQHRAATFVITNGTNSTGGAYNSATAFTDAISAVDGNGGGTIHVRRGSYTSGFPAAPSFSSGGLTMVGETAHDTSIVGSVLSVTSIINAVVGGPVHLKNLLFTRGGATALTTFTNSISLENVLWAANSFVLGNNAAAVVDLKNSRMLQASAGANGQTTGVTFNGGRVSASNCEFVGADGTIAGHTTATFGSNVAQGAFTDCTFRNNTAGDLLMFPASGFAKGLSFVGCYFTVGSNTQYVIDVPSTYAGGDITFTNCVFENTTSYTVIRLRHQGGRIRFVNCTFKAVGLPGATLERQQMFAIAPGGTATGLEIPNAIFEGCSATFTPTGYTSMAAALMEFGSEVSTTTTITPVLGRVVVRDFEFVLKGAVGLPPTTLMVLTARSGVYGSGNPPHGGNVFENITLQINDQRLPAAVTNIGGQPPRLVHVQGASTGSPRDLQPVKGLYFGGVSSPTVDGTAGGIIYARGAEITGVRLNMGVTAQANRFTTPQYLLESSTMKEAHTWLLNSTSAAAIFQLTGVVGTHRSILEDSEIESVYAGDGTFASYVFILSAGVLNNVRMRAGEVSSTALAIIGLAGGDDANSVLNCDIKTTSATKMIAPVAASITAGIRARIVGNRLTSGLLVGSTFIDLGAGGVTGSVISGNTIMTGGATAAACVPPLNTPSDLLTLVTSNNTFATSVASPN